MTGTDTAASLTDLVGSWNLNPAATTVELHTKAMWGLAKVAGSFEATEGSGTIGADGSVTGTLVLDAATINTKQAKRDHHLRTADFLDVDQFPNLTYDVTSASVAPDGGVTIDGTLTVHGETHPLPLTGTLTRNGADRFSLSVEADLDRSKWGIGWTKMGARLDNHLVVVAALTRA